MGVMPVILAAGASSRMGRAKALLEFPSGKSFLGRILDRLERVGLDRARLVLASPHQEEILSREPLVRPFIAVEVIENRTPEIGMLSSIQAGIDGWRSREDWSGVLIWPVDHPLVLEETVRGLLAASSSHPDSILIPTSNGRRGHPVILPRGLFSELENAPVEIGARSVVRGFPDSVVEWEGGDDGVISNLDRPEDYERWVLGRPDPEAPGER